jgi:hypothetical protein
MTAGASAVSQRRSGRYRGAVCMGFTTAVGRLRRIGTSNKFVIREVSDVFT